ncbi:ATP-binding cassette domain-containing protein [Spirochaeta isovalerica]|uniref:Putative multiple sugar transport system ATP-binding protein n=1 Tax=Spirochaeta isovalerica TaxID=150 RepID=A0A841R920_9SPIO|nr:ATP-binding cassette domain-containing protein [Spirochaeta isovalerica]MBB6481804.1 putative multiple sugar transport system ATP-binding protein [Spirochaeta isovalerica]
MKSITKTFPGVKALDDVDISVKKGDIHFIVGENGAGKSTLMKVLSGIYPHGSYDGDIIFDGQIKRFHGIKDSVSDGIVIINQELALFPNLTVYENVFVGHEIHNKLSVMSWDETKKEAKKYLDMVGLDVDLYSLVGLLGVGKQQLIEIAKALSQNVKLLILDEPTAALNEDDSENLLNLLLELKKQGLTSIMISHKLKEVEAIADSITVLRDGKTVAAMTKDEANEQTIIKNMVGREIEDIFPKRPEYKGGPVVLETVHLNAFDTSLNRYIVSNSNIKVHKGEVVGIAGLMGAGRTELAHSIFGNPKKYKLSGSTIVFGKALKLNSPKKAIEAGIAYVSEDRKKDGLILEETIGQNITVSALKKISRMGIINFLSQNRYAEKYVKDIDIRTPSVLQQVKNLSGGNQQKVQVSKWLFAEPKILILDEPTRGIDVGAKYEIYTIINDLVAKGMSIIIISSELPEILGMCDRIYVIAEGVQTAEFDIKDATPEKIMHSATTA